MKYFKKYPIFFLVVSLLCAAFVAGIGYDFYQNLQRVAAEKKLTAAMKSYRNALADDPTQKAIDASEANIQKLESHLKFLESDLTRASKNIFKKLSTTEGYQLVEQLRGMVNSWRRDAKNLGIVVGDDMDFGFKKYVEPSAQPPKDVAVPAIWKQACVLNYTMEKLFACKSEKSPMSIISIQREILPIEEEADAKNKKKRPVSRYARLKDDTKGDNFAIDKAITARKDKSLNTIAYRFIFTGHTDVLRRFLNQLKDFDAMLVVRSIDVKPADTTTLAIEEAASSSNSGGSIFDMMGGATGSSTENASTAESTSEPQPESATPADGTVTEENRTPVVTDNISEFTVVIEYVEVVNDVSKEEATSQNEASTSKKSAPQKK